LIFIVAIKIKDVARLIWQVQLCKLKKENIPKIKYSPKDRINEGLFNQASNNKRLPSLLRQPPLYYHGCA